MHEPAHYPQRHGERAYSLEVPLYPKLLVLQNSYFLKNGSLSGVPREPLVKHLRVHLIKQWLTAEIASEVLCKEPDNPFVLCRH